MKLRRISAAQLRINLEKETLIVKAPFIVMNEETGAIESINSMIGAKCEPGDTEYLEGRLEIGKAKENIATRVVNSLDAAAFAGLSANDLVQVRKEKRITLG